MLSLNQLLKKMSKELKEREVKRQRTQQDMRKAIGLSKQAILSIHQKRPSKAEQLIKKAGDVISELERDSDTYPEIVYCSMFSAARQEYAEANIFLKLTQDSRLITPAEINTPPIDYILGLADVVGEYRRLALDSLRQGDLEKGEGSLQVMDEIYTELMSLEEAYLLVPGLRRKCDILRRVIEATRGDITQEARRDSLEKSLKLLETTIRRGTPTKKNMTKG